MTICIIFFICFESTLERWTDQLLKNCSPTLSYMKTRAPFKTQLGSLIVFLKISRSNELLKHRISPQTPSCAITGNCITKPSTYKVTQVFKWKNGPDRLGKLVWHLQAVNIYIIHIINENWGFIWKCVHQPHNANISDISGSLKVSYFSNTDRINERWLDLKNEHSPLEDIKLWKSTTMKAAHSFAVIFLHRV